MRFILAIVSLLTLASASAKELIDTIWTRQNDKIILTYNVSADQSRFTIDFSRPRIIPSRSLRDACKGEIDKLKVVVFDRVGDFGKVKWSGISPSAFMVPLGLSYEKTSDGFYILGESQSVEFSKHSKGRVSVDMPLYIAVYEKKKKYRIVSTGKSPLVISTVDESKRTGRKTVTRTGTETEQIAVTSSEETEDEENDAITAALNSISMINELLARETESPFSQGLQGEIMNLRTLKNQIKDREVLNRINDVLLKCDEKERELRDAQNQSALAAKAQEQALIQQQKHEDEARQKEAEEKARIQEEKQEKRTLWMIIGGVILGILGFVGNAVFRHFRDVRNQKSIMQMQESIARQAENEAGRRSREIIRNKTHQMVNKGRGKLRDSISGKGKKPDTSNNSKMRSI